MADQLRYDWLGIAGTLGVNTPNIDRLASRGIWFTHLVTNAAICAPARISLATGRRPFRHGALDNDSSLDHRDVTYYQRLRDHGYHVGVIGKIDLNKPDFYHGRGGDRPATYSWGFTHPLEAEGKMQAGGMNRHRPLGPYGYWLEERGLFEKFATDYTLRLKALWGPLQGQTYRGDGLYRDSVLPENAFEDWWIGERAVEWINLRASSEYPWHLFVSFVGPHDPFDPPVSWAEKFRDTPVAAAIPAKPGKPGYADPGLWKVSSDEVAIARRQYSASLAVIDKQVGDILAVLKSRGFDDSTIVVFTSDHGEMLGDHGLFQKCVPYEGSMRIPLIVTGPDIEPGVNDALIELADLNPTLCELAGLEPQRGIDARSIVPMLTRQAPDHRDAVLCTEPHYRAIRTATHKYVHNTGVHKLARHDDVDELYDLRSDPSELHNLLVEDPGASRSLLREFAEREIQELT